MKDNIIKEEIGKIAEDVIVGFTKAPPNSGLKSAIVIGAKGMGKLGDFSRKIAVYLTTKGHFAEMVDSNAGDIDIRRIAASASLGSIGKSSLVITPQFGPRVKFSVVLTDALIETGERGEFDFCEGCNACIKACPTGAITDFGYNKSACEHHRGNVCVLCVEACPVGKEK